MLGQEATEELATLTARQQSLDLVEPMQPADDDQPSTEEVATGGAVTDPPPVEDPASKAEGAPGVADEKKATREADRKLREFMRATVDALIADYATSERGIEIREVAGGLPHGHQARVS